MGSSSLATAVAAGALGLANLIVGTSLIPSLLGRGAPFVPTASTKIEALFGKKGLLVAGSERSLLPHGTHPAHLRLVDLGSGDGSLLRAATRTAAYGHAAGYEINPWLVAYARLVSAGRSTKEVTHWTSMWEASLDEADVVLIYGVPPIMEGLGKKLAAELRPGAIVVCNGYELPEHALGHPVAEVFIETSRWSSDASSNLFCYRR
eukprot:scaffold147790_cov29-Tisochrysis_lutea.AAC.7